MAYEAPVSLVEIINNDAVGASHGGPIYTPEQEF